MTVDPERRYINERPQFLILGKRSKNDTSGNKYCTVKVIDLNSGETIIQTDRRYGYGEMWFQYAYEELTKLGLVSKEDRFNHELNSKRFVKECITEVRKSDLTW